jgi:hypothetical protein
MPTSAARKYDRQADDEPQGHLASLDEPTRLEAVRLQKQLGGTPDGTLLAFFIWGSIRALSVYGKWSWWRNPKKA